MVEFFPLGAEIITSHTHSIEGTYQVKDFLCIYGVLLLSSNYTRDIGKETSRVHMVDRSKGGMEVVETVLISRKIKGGKVIKVSNVKSRGGCNLDECKLGFSANSCLGGGMILGVSTGGPLWAVPFQSHRRIL